MLEWECVDRLTSYIVSMTWDSLGVERVGGGGREGGGREGPGEGAGGRELYYCNNTPGVSILWRRHVQSDVVIWMNIQKLRGCSVKTLVVCVYIQEKEIQPRLEPDAVLNMNLIGYWVGSNCWWRSGCGDTELLELRHWSRGWRCTYTIHGHGSILKLIGLRAPSTSPQYLLYMWHQLYKMVCKTVKVFWYPPRHTLILLLCMSPLYGFFQFPSLVPRPCRRNGLATSASSNCIRMQRHGNCIPHSSSEVHVIRLIFPPAENSPFCSWKQLFAAGSVTEGK